MKKHLIFKGAASALITPMKNGKIDYAAFSDIIEHQIACGISALVVGGTTGEAATLSVSERYELYSFAKDKINGRTKLIFGTGTNDTDMVIKHTKTASYIGCDAVLAVTPYYNKGTYKGVTEHYKKIASMTDVPIILYNVPSRTGVNLTIEQLSELSKCESIVGIKEASDSIDRFAELSVFKDELYLYAGNDSQILPTLALGGVGVISVVSNIFPVAIKRLCDECFAGDLDSARAHQTELLNFIKAMFVETNPSPIKYAMSKMGMCTSDVRLPLFIPEEKNRQIIEDRLSELSHLK